MAIAGAGIGALVQNIVLVVQNTVDVTEVGAASGAIAFFRSLGGAVGVSALGAVLTNLVAGNVSDGLASLGVDASAMPSGDTKLDISSLPGPVQTVIHFAYSDAFGPIFMISAATAVVTFVCILLVKEAPLRTTIAKEPADRAAQAPAVDVVPTDADADRRDDDPLAKVPVSRG